jgi:hypothetical protein
MTCRSWRAAPPVNAQKCPPVGSALTRGDYVYSLSLTYANATRPANKAALLAALRSFRVVPHA